MLLQEKTRFFLVNLFRGIVWLIVILLIVWVIKRYTGLDRLALLISLFENVPVIIAIFTASEFFFGIIPPELFMIWAMRFESVTLYTLFIILFGIISYIAGICGFLAGKYLTHTLYYRYLRRRYLGKYQGKLQQFGFFLIIVAAVTPLPYSAISALMGSMNYPLKKFMLYALSRFIRFAVYALIIWKADIF